VCTVLHHSGWHRNPVHMACRKWLTKCQSTSLAGMEGSWTFPLYQNTFQWGRTCMMWMMLCQSMSQKDTIDMLKSQW
jgi:hypothetical protein